MFHFHWHHENKKVLSGFCLAFVPIKKTLGLKFREANKPCLKPKIFSWS